MRQAKGGMAAPHVSPLRHSFASASNVRDVVVAACAHIVLPITLASTKTSRPLELSASPATMHMRVGARGRPWLAAGRDALTCVSGLCCAPSSHLGGWQQPLPPCEPASSSGLLARRQGERNE